MNPEERRLRWLVGKSWENCAAIDVTGKIARRGTIDLYLEEPAYSQDRKVGVPIMKIVTDKCRLRVVAKSAAGKWIAGCTLMIGYTPRN